MATHSSRSGGSPAPRARLRRAPCGPRGARGRLVSGVASPAAALTCSGRSPGNVTLLLDVAEVGGGARPGPSAFRFQSMAQRRTARWRLWAACNSPGQVVPCPASPPGSRPEAGEPGPPAPAAGHAAAAGGPSCPRRTAGGRWRPPGGAAGGRPAPPAPASPSSSSSPAQSPATLPTPSGGEVRPARPLGPSRGCAHSPPCPPPRLGALPRGAGQWDAEPQYLGLKREGPEPQGPGCVPLLPPPLLQLQPERRFQEAALTTGPHCSQTPLCQAEGLGQGRTLWGRARGAARWAAGETGPPPCGNLRLSRTLARDGVLNRAQAHPAFCQNLTQT